MNKAQGTPGVDLVLEHVLTLQENDPQAAEKEAQALIDVYVTECFQYIGKQLNYRPVYGTNGMPGPSIWKLLVSVIPNEKVLKKHEEYLSKQINKKVHVTRFLEENWFPLNDAERKTALEQLSANVTNPKIVHTIAYSWNGEKKVAVFFYYE